MQARGGVGVLWKSGGWGGGWSRDASSQAPRNLAIDFHQKNKSNQLNQSLAPNIERDLAGPVPFLRAAVCLLAG